MVEVPRLLSRGSIAYAESVASDASYGRDILTEFSRRMILAGALKIVQQQQKFNGMSFDLRALELAIKDELGYH